MAGGFPTETRGNGLTGTVPILFAAALFAYFVSMVPTIAATDIIRVSIPWVPSLGIEFAFLVDGLSLTFSLLISGIGTLVLLYSNTYLAGHPQYARFALFLTAFMVSMLGLVLADGLILLFVFWELTTITSYMLIGFSHESEKSRRNALQALFVTGAGGLAFLAGLILLAAVSGTTSISGIIGQGSALKEHAMYLPILILLLAGTFTKSAQAPFHFWLPNAMAAPTPVSAFLHSATMVKAGIYVMARMHPAMSGTDVWLWTLTIFGAVTAIFASLLALRQTDLKQALAYTTLMALGTLTLFLGQESGYAMTAFATFLVVHSLYKASLFLVVGCIDLSTGTRETDQLAGLGRLMPITAVAAALAALSMAGFPPFLGFIGKELKYAGALAVASEPVLVAGAALLSNSLMLAVAGVVAFRPFWRGTVPSGQSPREAPWQMWAGPIILASLGALFGIYPDLLQTTLINPTVISLTGEVEEAKELKLWAGFNIPLILSIATFVLGLLIYARHVQLRALLARVFAALPNLDNGWDGFLDGFKNFAKLQTAFVQNGKLSSYLFATFLTIAAGILLTLVYTGMPFIDVDLSDVEWKHASIALLTISGAILALFTNSRIAGIAALGVVGIGIALIFIVFSAPDVAITQLLVETLIVVLVSVVMLRLPSLPKAEFRLGHAALSVAMGVAVSLTLIAVVSSPLDLRLTDYFEATSWPEAYGRNIVNVILVDFRALDTFGEIAVVVIAALSAYALLRTTRKGGQS